PLYRSKRGSSEVYLKDDRALEGFLIETGIDGLRFELADGRALAGGDLKGLVERSSQARAFMRGAIRRVRNGDVIEQAAIEGAFDPALYADPARAGALGERIAERLNALAAPEDRSWSSWLSADGGLGFSRTLRGVTETCIIEMPIIKSGESHRLHAIA